MGVCQSVVNEDVFKDLTEKEFYLQLQKNAIHEDCQLIFAIDATSSNDTTRYGGLQNYHDVSTIKKNVYENVIDISTRLFKQTDSLIPLYFFGSEEAFKSKNNVLFAGNFEHKDLLGAYRKSISSQTLSGPTYFIDIIELIAEQVKYSKKYTVLIIISDGAVNGKFKEHIELLKKVSNLPLAITCIGVGNADFSTMNMFDDVRGRTIDNFQFTELNKVCKLENLEMMKNYFFYQCFMEIPQHYQKCKLLLNYEPTRKINYTSAPNGTEEEGF